MWTALSAFEARSWCFDIKQVPPEREPPAESSLEANMWMMTAAWPFVSGY
uniref:Uncharacterized protein n=1 Tax=Peronospora matthiolae TaxID=2874970 RepID=A0AAV1USQ0_9STRA